MVNLRMLYMVYVRLEDDAEDREWIIDMTPGEVAALEMRLDAIVKREGYSPVREHGVVLLVDGGMEDLDEFLGDLEG